MAKLPTSGGRFYEFFAGGGMARAGLGASWTCVFANDNDPKKVATYQSNWGRDEMKKPRSVVDLKTNDLPGTADLVWASFPCQDLSLAGNGAGLKGARSGTFWPFWYLIQQLGTEDRRPGLVVLENVCGALSSHSGRDFVAIARALGGERYRFGALVIDAVHFVPQSRPRLFIIAIAESAAVPAALTHETPDPTWSPKALKNAYGNLPSAERDRWIWWSLARPPKRTIALSDLIEDEPGIRWHTPEETERLIALMSPLNRKKLEQQRLMRRRAIGTVYKRTRPDHTGKRSQRAEVRFDEIAGCLRTPAGGSSRQTVVFVERDRIRSRLLSPREAARLMGLPDDYKLPANYNDAYHLAGDGVAVPVVRHLAAHILEPLLEAGRSEEREAA
jgi:DNA (cytosine-5)-methyltransferase 1